MKVRRLGSCDNFVGKSRKWEKQFVLGTVSFIIYNTDSKCSRRRYSGKHSDIRFSRQLVAPGWQIPYIWIHRRTNAVVGRTTGSPSLSQQCITETEGVEERTPARRRSQPSQWVDLLSLQRTNWVLWSKYDTSLWSSPMGAGLRGRFPSTDTVKHTERSDQ